MAQLTRTTVSFELDELPDLDGLTVAKAAARLAEAAATYPTTAKIDWRQRDHSESYYYAVIGRRDETDDELAKRQAQQDQREVRERAEFERLRAKYG